MSCDVEKRHTRLEDLAGSEPGDFVINAYNQPVTDFVVCTYARPAIHVSEQRVVPILSEPSHDGDSHMARLLRPMLQERGDIDTWNADCATLLE